MSAAFSHAPPRHAQLFELLRQQNLSDGVSARIRARGLARDRMQSRDSALLRSLAVSSWAAPDLPQDQRPAG